jgi:hypothetical protein
MQAAGFDNVSIETITAISLAPTPQHAAFAFCQGTPLRNEIETRDASLLEEVTKRAGQAIAVRFGDGAVEGKIQAHVITGSL